MYLMWTDACEAEAINVYLKSYNHATTNLAIYSNETSQDKLPEA